MTTDRFYLLVAGASRATRVPLPPWTTVKAGAGDTEGRFTLMENRGDAEIPAHVHDTFDEFVYVIDGELGLDYGGTTHRVTGGMCFLVPRGVTHAMRNLGGPDAPVHALQLSAPGGWERYLEDVTEARQSGEWTPDRDWAKANAIGKPHGMRYHLGIGDPGDWGDRDRFYLLGKGRARPGRIAVPPAFSVKARTTDTDGLFSALEVTVAQPIPRHIHHVADECVYVLDGRLEVEFDDRIHLAGPGELVFLPHGVPHALRPGSTPPPRVIQISSPGGWECVVEAIIEHRTEVSAGGRFDPGALNRYTRRYHVVYDED
ncbi:cupin domain-containing protein [Nocardia cyriacigeorgica]|uniref:Cupin domain-containing protein n=1 Tax=Nocardia cyriacigeorgica TaxID=135487 RepID=A0A5R8NYI4_9NOCA|nr:cupin domain-containing protein [Nocardia cyriacigeorgica]TLF81089.1 cupin domain-containing protein [Nocardia cyriacigeorgica]